MVSDLQLCFHAEEARVVCFSVPSALSLAVVRAAAVRAGAERRCPAGAAGGAAGPRPPLCKWQR